MWSKQVLCVIMCVPIFVDTTECGPLFHKIGQRKFPANRCVFATMWFQFCDETGSDTSLHKIGQPISCTVSETFTWCVDGFRREVSTTTIVFRQKLTPLLRLNKSVIAVPSRWYRWICQRLLSIYNGWLVAQLSALTKYARKRENRRWLQ